MLRDFGVWVGVVRLVGADVGRVVAEFEGVGKEGGHMDVNYIRLTWPMPWVV